MCIFKNDLKFVTMIVIMKNLFSVSALTLLLLSSLFVSAQYATSQVNFITSNPLDTQNIYYRPHIKLVWTDFQGIPQNIEKVAAVTSSGIGYSYNFKRVDDVATIHFNVYCPFRKSKSWVLNNEKKTDYILNHEQHHFDISYLNMLLFIQTLRNTKFPMNDYKKLIVEKYAEASAALNKMQQQYDAETKNGLDVAKQNEWTKKIDDQIAKLSEEVLPR